MLATQYCVQMQKNIRNKQDELTQFIATEKAKPNPNQDKIQEAHHIFKISITIKSADP